MERVTAQLAIQPSAFAYCVWLFGSCVCTWQLVESVLCCVCVQMYHSVFEVEFLQETQVLYRAKGQQMVNSEEFTVSDSVQV